MARPLGWYVLNAFFLLFVKGRVVLQTFFNIKATSLGHNLLRSLLHFRLQQEVNLSLKSKEELELNPAYIEQRIQDALKTGEADEFEFGYHRLEFKQIIGKGAFGKVFLAEAYGIGGNEPTSLVAVKVLNGELLKVLKRRDILSNNPKHPLIWMGSGL